MNAPGTGAAAEGRIADVTAALLTGGASRRMGRDKAQLPTAGVAGAVRLAHGLAGLFETLLLVGGAPPQDAPGRRVPDPEDAPSCALRGLVAALDAARTEKVLVVATDLPALTPELVLALVAAPEAEAVVPRPGGVPQPLCALYRREPVLRVARERLAAGRLALRDVLEVLSVTWLDDDVLACVDPPGLALRNVNTPEEHAALEAALAAQGGDSW